MKAYSEDLRKKVVEAVRQRGTSKSEAARLFSISLSSVKRYARFADRGEALTPRKGGGRPPIADDATRKLLEEDVRTRPAATVEERRRFLESFAAKSMSEPTFRRLMKRMGFSRKKDCGETYIERVLVPTLRKGQVVVMDNLSVHKGERVRDLIADRGCELLYLPSYSPELNPIEEAFSKIKGLLRKARARSREALLEAIGAAILAVSDRDAFGYFEHCGYRTTVQPF